VVAVVSHILHHDDPFAAEAFRVPVPVAAGPRRSRMEDCRWSRREPGFEAVHVRFYCCHVDTTCLLVVSTLEMEVGNESN
jgi:hypothetical protein